MIRKKLKIAVGAFFAAAVIGLASGVAYLESGRFADFLKKMISERSPQKIGVVGNFSNLKLYFFPPAIGIANPTFHLERENITKLPIEADIEATELRIVFAPIQMLSGTLQVDEFRVIQGSVQAKLSPELFKPQKKPEPTSGKFRIQDLFKLQINGVRFEDTYLNVQADLPDADHSHLTAELVVKDLSLSKAETNHKKLLISHALVNAVKFDIPKKFIDLPLKEANQLQWDLELSDDGLKLAPFTMDLPGMNLKLNGTLIGNNLNAETSVTSDLGVFFNSNLDDDRWSGSAEVSAKVEAHLNDIRHTLKGSYDVSAKDFAWKDVKVSQLKGSGKVDLAQEFIELKSLDLTDNSDAKEGKSPGQIKIENAAIPLKLNQPFNARVNLQNADMHWLGGAVMSTVYPLQGKFSGPMNVKFLVERNNQWRLRAEPDVKVENFAFTNQKINVPRPLHYIVKPAVPFTLKGAFEVSPAGLEFKGLNLKLVKSSLDIEGGVYAKRGFDFRAKGPVDLKEIDQIVENKIIGEGTLEAYIHGPSSGVLLEFGVHTKNTEYLNLHFGDVDGQVTYDDGLYELRFDDVHAHQRNTFYSVDHGIIDLNSNDVHIPFEIHSGKVEDIAYIMDHIVKNVSWYPTTLHGDIHGKIGLGGKLDLPHMIIASTLEGTDWSWMGERARKVRMDAGYDQGNYYARNVQITKTSGVLSGDIEFNAPTDQMKWNFQTDNMSLLDIDFVDRLEIPAKSRIDFQSSGSGKMDKLKSKTEGRFYGTEIKGELYEPSTVNVEVGESTLRANFNIFGKKLQSQVKYALIEKQPSSIKVEFNHFDFSPAILILNPKLLDDPDLAGSINGHVQLDFLSTQLELARGQIAVDEYYLRKSGFDFHLKEPIDIPIQLGYFNMKPAHFVFQNSELTMSGEGHKGDVDVRIVGAVDLAIAELISSSIQKIHGKADADIRISGQLKALKVNGDLTFSGVTSTMRWLQTPFEDMDGTIRIRQNLIYVERIQSNLGDSLFALTGKIETFADQFPKLDLRAQFEDNKIKMSPLELAQVRGTATISGSQPPYIIGGNLELLQGLWSKSFGSSNAVTVRGGRFAPVDLEKQASNTMFVLDLNVNAPQNFYVKNDIIDGEFRGKIKLVGPADNPKLLGEGNLVQGKVLFRDRPFILESVKVTFDDPFQMDPKFNAAAVSEINQYKIRVLAYGKASSWKAEFSSTPFLPENEIFSLLTAGYTSTEGSRYKTRDRSYVSQGEAASLILHSLDFSKDIQNKTGFQFDVEEAADSQFATSIFRPQNLNENIASPKVVIKRSLGQRFDLSFGSTVGVGSEVQREVNAEYKLTHGMSVLGVWNNIEEVDTRDVITSFGMDLRFSKKFK